MFTEFTQILQKEDYVPKISTICQNCGKTFEKWPAAFRYAESQGTTIKFCSHACIGEARTKGMIGAKKRRGETLTCEVCNSLFYRPQSMIAEGKSRFCSEPCRLRAHELRMIDRTHPRPQNMRGNGINCFHCGKLVYRKKSELIRNVGKTCGDTICVSAYGRSLWGLAPHDPESFRLPRARRRYRGKSNFSSMQRATWIDDKCAWCSTTDNLTLDHIIPVCCGGKATRENAQTLCGSCNNWKAKYVDRPLARKQLLSGGLQG
jgi:HNH endonuclease